MVAFITLIGSIFFLVALSIGFSFGFIYFVLSFTRFKSTSLILSTMFLPVGLVVALSGFGYFKAGDVIISVWKFLLPLGFVATFLVCIKYKNEIFKIFYCQKIMAFSMMSGLFSLAPYLYLNSTKPYAYNYLGNGEFLNYARLASIMLHPKQVIIPFFAYNQSIRFGQDIFLSITSEIFNRNPIEMVHIVSGYLLFTYGSAIGLIISGIFGTRWLGISLIWFHGLMLTALFNYNSSWFSSTLILPATVLVLAYSTTRLDVISLKEKIHSQWKSFFSIDLLAITIFLIFYIVFVAISYPEFGLPSIGAAILLAGYQSFRDKTLYKSLISLMISLFFVLVFNPLVLIKAINNFFNQLHSNGGWNLFGDPRKDPVRFFIDLNGISFPLAKHISLLSNIIGFIMIVIWIFSLWTILKYAKNIYKNMHLIPSIRVMTLWVILSIISFLIPFKSGGNWYPNIKFFCQFSIGFVLLYGITLYILNCYEFNKSLKNSAYYFFIFFIFLFSINNINNVYTIKKDIIVFEYMRWVAALKKFERKEPLIVVHENEGEVLWFTEIVIKHLDIKLLPISEQQVDRLSRGALRRIAMTGNNLFKMRCGMDSSQIVNDFISWENIPKRALVVVGVHDPYGRLVSDQGRFSLSILHQKTIARLGKIRIDDVEFKPINQVFFPDGNWAVNGSWSACILPHNKKISVTYDVPKILTRVGPLEVDLFIGNKKTKSIITHPGHYSISLKLSDDDTINSPQLAVLKASRTFIPKEIDHHSSDPRKLGVIVNSVTF